MKYKPGKSEHRRTHDDSWGIPRKNYEITQLSWNHSTTKKRCDTNRAGRRRCFIWQFRLVANYPYFLKFRFILGVKFWCQGRTPISSHWKIWSLCKISGLLWLHGMSWNKPLYGLDEFRPRKEEIYVGKGSKSDTSCWRYCRQSKKQFQQFWTDLHGLPLDGGMLFDKKSNNYNFYFQALENHVAEGGEFWHGIEVTDGFHPREDYKIIDLYFLFTIFRLDSLKIKKYFNIILKSRKVKQQMFVWLTFIGID